MIEVSNADRIVFPEVGRTKGDVVAYYDRLGARALVHLAGRPLSIRRYPKGLAASGFFQKNVPPHYPSSIGRFEVPRSPAASKAHPHRGAKDQEITTYPVVSEAEHLAYLANQGAIELHVPTSRVNDPNRPDRIVLDLDPPSDSFELVRRAAAFTRAALDELGLPTIPVATGSKGYHVVACIRPTVDIWVIAETLQKFAALLAARHPNELTMAFRVKSREGRVFLDWLRNRSGATVIAPFSLRATPRATVAVPLAWDELDRVDPDAFTIDDAERLLARTDTLAELQDRASDPMPFVAAVEAQFTSSGLALEHFDRFRS